MIKTSKFLVLIILTLMLTTLHTIAHNIRCDAEPATNDTASTDPEGCVESAVASSTTIFCPQPFPEDEPIYSSASDSFPNVECLKCGMMIAPDNLSVSVTCYRCAEIVRLDDEEAAVQGKYKLKVDPKTGNLVKMA